MPARARSGRSTFERARGVGAAAVIFGALLSQSPRPLAQQPAQPPAQASPAGQAQPQQTPPPDQTDVQTFRGGINFVRVDVIVSDREGQPVQDLQPTDFEVLEDGKPQAIETFKLIRYTGQVEQGGEPAREIRSDYVEETEAQRDDVRLFAIFLDDYHVRRGASMGVREPLIRFLQNELGPLDMVALMYPLTPVSDLRFGRNRDTQSRAIETFLGRKFEYDPKNMFEQQYANYPVETVERIRLQVSLSALKGLVTRLGGMREGRKAVIVVSEGFSYYVPPSLRSPDAQMPTMGRGGGQAVESTPMEDRYKFSSDMDLQSDLRSVFEAANRANVALYTLDPRGLAAFEFDINEGVGLRSDSEQLRSTQDTLRVLAETTDGRAIVNRNDLNSGLKQIVQDSSAYYLLGYSSSQATDGKFHEIKVRVKRPRVQVRHRKGFWAYTAEETTAAKAPAKPAVNPGVASALAAVEAPSRARVVRTWIGSTRGEDGKTRVTFVWEPVPRTSGDRQPPPARVSLLAAGDGGAPYYRGSVPSAAVLAASNGASNGTNGSTSSRGGRIEFETPPGPVRLRLSVEGDDGQVLDSDMVDISAPDYTAPTLRVSSPQLFRARTIPELRALSADAAAVPTAERQFRRTDRLLLRFSAFAPGDAKLQPSVRLLNRGGDRMSDLTLESLAGVEGVWQVVLPLASLPAGEFVIEVAAKDGDSEAKEFVAFRVTS